MCSDSSFSSFFGESKIGQSTQKSCTISLGQSRKCFKSLRAFLAHKLTDIFLCLGAGRDTGYLCQPAQQAVPTTSWDGGHGSPDQHPAISPLLLASLLLLLCPRLRVLKTGFISCNWSNWEECRISGVQNHAVMTVNGKTEWMTCSAFCC